MSLIEVWTQHPQRHEISGDKHSFFRGESYFEGWGVRGA